MGCSPAARALLGTTMALQRLPGESRAAVLEAEQDPGTSHTWAPPQDAGDSGGSMGRHSEPG